MVLCASPPGLKQTFRCQHRDLILTRSAYDHKRMRPLKPMVGVVKSLGYYRRGPVGLVHTQKIEAQSEKPTWTKALEFTQFACPCGTDPRLLSGEQRTSHFKLVTSVEDPFRTSAGCGGDFDMLRSLGLGGKGNRRRGVIFLFGGVGGWAAVGRADQPLVRGWGC